METKHVSLHMDGCNHIKIDMKPLDDEDIIKNRPKYLLSYEEYFTAEIGDILDIGFEGQRFSIMTSSQHFKKCSNYRCVHASYNCGNIRNIRNIRTCLTAMNNIISSIAIYRTDRNNINGQEVNN